MARASETDPAGDAFDGIVIGAGVVGLAIAAACSRAGHAVLVLERDAGIGRGVTSRNSEVIHAGIYYPADSAKAVLCVEGREALYRYCAERRVAHRRTGKLIVATRPEEESILEDLLARGRANGVAGLELVDRARIRAWEPEVEARSALHSPETGIVDAHGLCLALLAEAEVEGAVLVRERGVRSLAPRSWGWTVETEAPDGAVESVDAGWVVDAAGLDADGIAGLAGIDLDAHALRQHPCKGDYFTLEPGLRLDVERLIYPVPAQAGLGVHLTLDLAGRIRFGPDAEYVSQRDYQVDPGKEAVFREAAARYLPRVAEARLRPDYAGIRPKLAGPGEGFRDFVLAEGSAWGAPGFVACIGIESPGLTAALAIGDRVAALLPTD